MNRAPFDFFELVRFFADVNDLADLNVASVQKSHSLFSARLSASIGALRTWMEYIYTQDIAILFY